MKRLFAVPIVFSLVVTLSAAAASPGQRLPLLKKYRSVVCIGNTRHLPGRKVPIKYVDRLRINTSLAYRVAVSEDEQAGIEDLRTLCLGALLEEHWIFLPEKKLWVEAGYDEKPGSAGIDLDFLKDVIVKNDNMSIYHIHVKSYLKSFEKEGYGRIGETWLVVPSFEDIALMVYFSSVFRSSHPLGKISWRICSPLGITKYALTDKGVKHYTQIKNHAFLLDYFCPSHGKAMDPGSDTIFDINASHGVDDLIQWANTQGKGYIDVGFSPYAGQR